MVSKKIPDCNSRVRDFVKKIKSGKDGSFAIAIKTITLIKELIKETEWKTAQDLICVLTHHGRTINEELPVHASAGNVVRRVLKIIREEYTAVRKNKLEEVDQQDSLHKIVTGGEDEVDNLTIEVPELEAAILDHLNEFQVELETSAENIANQGKEHIHSSEIIMTIGHSRTVEKYLKKASGDRKFEVIVVECAPFFHGRELARRLADSKIQTTLIPDSAIFGIMSRVNKLIIGTHTVMANGGLRAISGTHAAALSAKHYSVPVTVLAPLYKLSPKNLCSFTHETFNIFESPEGVLSYSDGDILSNVHVYNPVFDYVPPELVTLFISNTGGHAPSYVYRLLSELYHPDDCSF